MNLKMASLDLIGAICGDKYAIDLLFKVKLANRCSIAVRYNLRTNNHRDLCATRLARSNRYIYDCIAGFVDNCFAVWIYCRHRSMGEGSMANHGVCIHGVFRIRSLQILLQS